MRLSSEKQVPEVKSIVTAELACTVARGKFLLFTLVSNSFLCVPMLMVPVLGSILPLSCAHAARIPRSAVATPAERPGCSLGPFFPGLARVRLVRKLQHKEKRPPPPSPPPPQGRKGSLLVFDSCPKLHRPRSSRRRRQRLLTQGAGHRRKSIPDKNQLLPECAAAIDTRARRAPPFSSRGSSSNSDSGEGGKMRHTPQANVCSLGLKLRVPDWVARQFRNLTRCGHLSCSHAL